MDLKFEPQDKHAAFNKMLDDLFIAFRSKNNNEQLKEIYWQALEGIFTTLEYQEIKQVQQSIMLNCQWLPKAHELKEMAMKIIRAKRKKSPIKSVNKEQDKYVYDYKEMDLTDARRYISDNLSMFYDKESVITFVNCFDMMLRGFAKEDFDFFLNRLTNSNKVPETFDIINMLIWIKKKMVIPRRKKFKGEDVSIGTLPKIDRDKFHKMCRLLVKKEGPQLVKR